jgi:endonuclease-3 related protein
MLITGMAMTAAEKRLRKIYELLMAAYGPRQWWPAESPFEVCVGAILTQNPSWRNVEKAIANLKREGILSPRGMNDTDTVLLAEIIRPAGFHNVKSRRLKSFVAWLLAKSGGDVPSLFLGQRPVLRAELLALPGIGPETADAILLYAGQQPSFVVDAYTRRLFSRLGLVRGVVGYEELRTLFMVNLPADVPLYNEYHALIVEHCKVVCRKKPCCRECPLLGGGVCPGINGFV